MNKQKENKTKQYIKTLLKYKAQQQLNTLLSSSQPGF